MKIAEFIGCVAIGLGIIVLAFIIWAIVMVWPHPKVDGGNIDCSKVLALEEGTIQDWSICAARK